MINLSNPFKGRLYLNCFEFDENYGLKLKSVKLKKSKLGFTFKSNKHGLCGPFNENSNNVILGSSFAMGIGCDYNKVWWNYINQSKFLNLGIPVGYENLLNRLNDLHKGDKNNLFIIYHPNLFILNEKYELSKKKEVSIFKIMNWKTGLLNVTVLYFTWKIKKIIYWIKGRYKYFNYDNKKYFLDLNYCTKIYNQNISNYDSNILNLINKFENIYVFRIPVKEYIWALDKSNYQAKKIIKSHNSNFNKFKNIISKSPKNLRIINCIEKFKISDYNQYDTHWNENGNKVFSKIFLNTYENYCNDSCQIRK